MKLAYVFASYIALFVLNAAAHASTPGSCRMVEVSDVGRADNDALTNVLNGLGFEPPTQIPAVPVTFEVLSGKQIEVFVDDRVSMMEPDRKFATKDEIVDGVGVNRVRACPGAAEAGGVETLSGAIGHHGDASPPRWLFPDVGEMKGAAQEGRAAALTSGSR